ncbi:MAG: hypothetical protein M9900_09430 [Flavobacteriales bacterium]|nr:hypothetical protein [Flavobacteriales bacterium]
MKTIHLLFAAAGVACATTLAAQLPRIVVDGQGAPMVFSDLGAAMLAAPANSNLYLSGGSFFVEGGFALSKPLHFIGAGMHPDSTNGTGATNICTTGSGKFALISGASGTSFTGIMFTNEASPTISFGTFSGNQFVTDVDFLRCMFSNGVNLGVEEPSGTTSSFTECIFHGTFAGYGGTSVVNRCIFDYTPGTGGMITIFRPTGLYMLNSVVLGGKLDHCLNASIANCVFTHMGGAIWQSQDAQVSNCLFSDTLIFSNCTGLEENNVFGIPADAIFVNELDGKYQFTDDLHLAGSSPGAGAGNDGTDIGIYGTDSPYKPGGVPHTPHYRRIEVATGTDASGNLPVNVRVAAQPD